jgi:PadR family transcriptional regulator PadR
MVYSSELIKGTLKTILLKLLADNKKMYGYEITQRVREVSGDRIQITEGALARRGRRQHASG